VHQTGGTFFTQVCTQAHADWALGAVAELVDNASHRWTVRVQSRLISSCRSESESPCLLAEDRLRTGATKAGREGPACDGDDRIQPRSGILRIVLGGREENVAELGVSARVSESWGYHHDSASQYILPASDLRLAPKTNRCASRFAATAPALRPSAASRWEELRLRLAQFSG
jgi:hypothetical protein